MTSTAVMGEEEKKAAFKNLVILRKALMERASACGYDKAFVVYVVSRCWTLYTSEEGRSKRNWRLTGRYGLSRQRHFIDGMSSWWKSEEGYDFWKRISMIYTNYFDRYCPLPSGRQE